MRVPAIGFVLLLLLSTGLAARQGSTSSPLRAEAATARHPPGERVPVPDPSDKALSYYRTGTMLWVVDNLWGLLVPALFLFTGWSARLRTWAARLGRRWFFTIALYFVAFSVLTFLLNLPLAFYEGYVREHAYGLSNQTLGKWTRDTATALLVGTAVGVLFLWVPYLLLKNSPRRWWLYTGLAIIPFLVLISLVKPVWIDPLFNRFGPMKDKSIEADILSLADRAGIEGGRVYEVAKSEDTKALNAYVTGFGTTKRIVLWDTIIARLDRDELLFVMGHEMGHYVLGHVWQLIGFFSALIMATLYAIHLTAGWLIARYRDRFGFTDLADVASLPLVLLLFGVVRAGRHARGDGILASRRARSRPVRPRDHAEQPRGRHRVRQAADRQPRRPAAKPRDRPVPLGPSAARRPDRFLERLPAVGDGRTDGVRALVQGGAVAADCCCGLADAAHMLSAAVLAPASAVA